MGLARLTPVLLSSGPATVRTTLKKTMKKTCVIGETI